jgi:hypothetical protein
MVDLVGGKFALVAFLVLAVLLFKHLPSDHNFSMQKVAVESISYLFLLGREKAPQTAQSHGDFRWGQLRFFRLDFRASLGTEEEKGRLGFLRRIRVLIHA